MASDVTTKSLENVKKEIRALLISIKHGCTPKQLQDDYLQVMGDNIPYMRFGHTNMMSFIRSIPDVVSVCLTRNNTVLYGVPNSQTKKIYNLVAKQRSTKKGSPGWITVPPRMNMITKCSAPPSPKDPAVPSSFKVRLKELMLSYPNGIPVDNFNEAFAKRFHHYIAYSNWGFESVEGMISSVPDILYFHNDTTCNLKIVKRSAPQEKAVNEHKESQAHSGDGQVSISWYSLENQRKKSGNEEPRNVTPEFPAETCKEGTKKMSENMVVLENSLNSLELSFNVKKKLIDEIKSPPTAAKKGQCIDIPRKVVDNIMRLLKANKAGIWLSRFQLEYKEFNGVELTASSFGFSCCLHLLNNVTCCAMERPGGMGDWLVYLKGTTPPKVGGDHKSVSSVYLSDKLVSAVHSTLRGHMKGISVHTFPKEFLSVIGEELPLLELGFSSTSEFLQRVPGIQVVRPPGEHSVMVFSTYSQVEEKKEKMAKDEPHDWRKDLLEAKTSVYAVLALPEPSPTHFHGIYVTDVYSPSSFSVQLIRKDTTQVLEALQDDMTTFYTSKQGKCYTIEEVYSGQPCCASFNDGYWYRAEVEKLVCPDVVRIRYVDYGNMAEIPVTSIRRPKPNYLLLPAQAVESRLCHLKPAGSSWSSQAKYLLKEMTKDKALLCVITAVKHRLMSVYVMDTSTDRDILINDILVHQCLALLEVDTDKDERGEDVFSLNTHPTMGDGTMPMVRLPHVPYLPPLSPSASSKSLPSRHVFSQHLETTPNNVMPHQHPPNPQAPPCPHIATPLLFPNPPGFEVTAHNSTTDMPTSPPVPLVHPLPGYAPYHMMPPPHTFSPVKVPLGHQVMVPRQAVPFDSLAHFQYSQDVLWQQEQHHQSYKQRYPHHGQGSQWSQPHHRHGSHHGQGSQWSQPHHGQGSQWSQPHHRHGSHHGQGSQWSQPHHGHGSHHGQGSQWSPPHHGQGSQWSQPHHGQGSQWSQPHHEHGSHHGQGSQWNHVPPQLPVAMCSMAVPTTMTSSHPLIPPPGLFGTTKIASPVKGATPIHDNFMMSASSGRTFQATPTQDFADVRQRSDKLDGVGVSWMHSKPSEWRSVEQDMLDAISTSSSSEEEVVDDEVDIWPDADMGRMRAHGVSVSNGPVRCASGDKQADSLHKAEEQRALHRLEELVRQKKNILKQVSTKGSDMVTGSLLQKLIAVVSEIESVEGALPQATKPDKQCTYSKVTEEEGKKEEWGTEEEGLIQSHHQDNSLESPRKYSSSSVSTLLSPNVSGAIVPDSWLTDEDCGIISDSLELVGISASTVKLKPKLVEGDTTPCRDVTLVPSTLPFVTHSTSLLPLTTPTSSLPPVSPSTSLSSVAPSTSLSSVAPSASIPLASPTSSLPPVSPSTSLPPAAPSTSIPLATPSTSLTPVTPSTSSHGAKKVTVKCYPMIISYPPTSSNLCPQKSVHGSYTTQTYSLIEAEPRKRVVGIGRGLSHGRPSRSGVVPPGYRPPILTPVNSHAAMGPKTEVNAHNNFHLL